MAGVDELVNAVDVVGVAVVEEVAWVRRLGCAALRVLGVSVLCGWVLLHVLVLVLFLVAEAWGLRVGALRRWILHAMVLGVWVLHVCALHVRVLLLGLSLVGMCLVGLCLGGLSPDEVLLLHLGDVVVFVGVDIAVTKRGAADFGGVVIGIRHFRGCSGAALALLDCSSYSQWGGLTVSCGTWSRCSDLPG